MTDGQESDSIVFVVETLRDAEWVPHSYHAMRPRHVRDFVENFTLVCGLGEPDLARAKRASWYPPDTQILGYIGERR
jgi:hypothetical protein